MGKVKKRSIVVLFAVSLAVLTMPVETEAQSGSEAWTHSNGPVGGDSPYAVEITSDNSVYVGHFGRGVWRSNMEGTSWNRLYGTFNFSGDLLYIPYGRLIEGNEDGIRYSDDEGQTWTEMEMDNGVARLDAEEGLIAAHMDNDDSYEVNDSYLKFSTDSGKTWSRTHVDSARGVEELSDIEVVSDDSVLAATNIGVLVFSLRDTSWTQSSITAEVTRLARAEGRLFADMYRSTDGGVSWDSLESYPISEMSSLTASSSGDIYAATLDTLLHSPDFGDSWETLSEDEIPRLDVRSINTDRSGNLYIGLYEAGVFKYMPTEESWEVFGAPTTNVLSLHTTANGRLLAGTQRSGLNTYTAADGWSKSYGPYEESAIGVIESAGDRLIVGRAGPFNRRSIVQFSEDGGESWTVHDSVIVAENFEDATPTAYANSDDGMFIGTRELGVSHSTDATSWEASNDSLPFEEIYDLEVDSDGTVLASGDDEGLYQWNAADMYWTKIQPSADTLLDADINSIAVHPSGAVIADRWIRPAGSTSWDTLHMPDNNEFYDVEVEVMEITEEGTIYLASWNGAVYKSDDMAESWETIATEFGDDDEGLFTDMAFTEDKVLLATESRGVYQWSRSGTSIDPKVDELPSQITLEQNYPNPFNPTTNISYTIPVASSVELTVYNVLGQRIATLVDAKKQAGQYRVQFDAGNLSSGVYLYQLETNRKTLMRKMMLVK